VYRLLGRYMHSSEIEKLKLELMQKRLLLGCAMTGLYRARVRGDILRENPNISKANLKKELFLKFYKDDFSPEERERILNYFDKALN
jgi:hypothetical protein